MKKTLWRKNFTLITLGTLVSAIGSVSMSFAGTLLVYDESQSTLLSGLFAALSMLPQVVLPLLVAPWLDRTRRKPLIAGLDLLSGVLYLALALYLWLYPFSYLLYLSFSLLISSISAVYQLAYDSLYPRLIPPGLTQKGYTVSGMIYPTVTMIMTPVAAVFYEYAGIVWLCALQGLLLLAASAMETQIRVEETVQPYQGQRCRQYFQDIRNAVTYLKREKGLQRIYTFMPITQGISMGASLLIMAWFQSPQGLGASFYALFTTAEFIGRTVGGMVHYRLTIPPKARFGLSYLVYQLYSLMDGILLWLPYPLMLINRGICGFLGINSATLRSSAVQTYVPDAMRAKLNALFQVCMAFSTLVCRICMGALGELWPAPLCIAVLSLVNLAAGALIIGTGRKDIAPIYQSYD